MTDDPLTNPDLYLDRELSQLAFNRRVLAQASDPEVPLLERLRYLTITATNMDEFFEVRVAALKQRQSLGLDTPDAFQDPPAQVLAQIGERAHVLIREQYCVLNEVLIPALARAGIRFLRRDLWDCTTREWIARYFADELEPVLTPIGLDPAHPFPRIQNKSLNFLVTLRGRDAFGRNARHAVVQTPRTLPRLVTLPPELGGRHDFVFLSSILHAHVDALFPGMTVSGCYQFRVTRDSALYLDEEEIDDLKQALAVELGARSYGSAVRLEVAESCPPEHARFLLRHFALEETDLYRVEGPVNLGRLATVIEQTKRADLKWPVFTPAIPPPLGEGNEYFSAIRAGAILLHHPYESFAPVLEFLRQAARDPQVLAIKQTLYRAGSRSPVVEILLEAAKAGKEITVVIELLARFDEAENIALATRLQDAGAHVVYGVVGLKTHAKLLLVVRREGAQLRRYVHLGTGNYNPQTARLYCDYGLFSADPSLGADVHRLFMGLTGLGRPSRMTKLLESPFSLREALLRLIAREAEHARAGARARIVMKVNALTDAGMIRALYLAGRAGVDISLIVRGMCCLRPGVAGVSHTIRVRSIVGRFLEHGRVYYFSNAGDAALYLASSDLMERNLSRRIEAAFPIESAALRRRILKALALDLRDNREAWQLGGDGHYRRTQARGRPVLGAQRELLRRLSAEDVIAQEPSRQARPADTVRAARLRQGAQA